MCILQCHWVHEANFCLLQYKTEKNESKPFLTYTPPEVLIYTLENTQCLAVHRTYLQGLHPPVQGSITDVSTGFLNHQGEHAALARWSALTEVSLRFSCWDSAECQIAVTMEVLATEPWVSTVASALNSESPHQFLGVTAVEVAIISKEIHH